MPTVAIRLLPAALADPDADLRYRVPDLLEERTNRVLQDAGYDYEPGTDAMLIFMQTADLAMAREAVAGFLAESAHVLGQDLRPAAQAGVTEADPDQAVDCVLFFPAEQQGQRVVFPS